MNGQKKQASDTSLDELDSAWEDDVPSTRGDELDAGWEDEPEEPEPEEPEPPGLTPAEREARAAAKKERAHAKALAKKERRKARARAASSKQGAKQKKRPKKPPPSHARPTSRNPEVVSESAPALAEDPAPHARRRTSRPTGQVIALAVAAVLVLAGALAFLLGR